MQTPPPRKVCCSSIPIVPFASYEEYEDLLSSTILDYQAMVLSDVAACHLTDWCRFHGGLGPRVKCRWLHEGVQLFMKLTKGRGEGWCRTMNTMVVHALDTSLRVMVETRNQMYAPMFGNDQDRLDVVRLLGRETALAISDERFNRSSNLSEFRFHNFVLVCRCCMHISDLLQEVDHIPIARAQEMQLAFAMISHPRLGRGVSTTTVDFGRCCDDDVIRIILENVFEPVDDNDNFIGFYSKKYC